MTWSLVGWIFIGLSAVLLLIFRFLLKERKAYPVRRFPAVHRLKTSRVSALERGMKRGVFIVGVGGCFGAASVHGRRKRIGWRTTRVDQ